ncbi:hypothetical protein TGPRC2_425130 [Toxoplasma gondii TgCatPRC2]|uniref:EF hand protein n=1 Tax=Toxoplasma gondii TgCatPRC2 TaxID=1130821 RepID=A0A151HCT6_TOXGO|nr:hypothetical protein TGPRC2_425130 [Toxoplasma gondii TgCatPRC2]
MATNDSYPPNVEAIEQRIKSIIFPRRIRIQEFIQRFDLLHHRVVGQQQFVRALNQCGVSLDHDEAKVLFHKYADEKTGGVRYYEFCDNINTVFRITQAEENPLLEPPPPGKFTEEEIALLAEYFSREDADVNYNFIHNMIADKATELYLPFATSSYAPRSSNRRWSHEDMEPERKIQDDWDYLVAKYSRADGMFNYEALCDQIDRAFTMAVGLAFYYVTEDLEKHPLARVNMPGKEIVEPAKRNRIQLLPEEEAQIDRLEQVIRTNIAKTRKAVKPTFQDFDKQRTLDVH